MPLGIWRTSDVALGTTATMREPRSTARWTTPAVPGAAALALAPPSRARRANDSLCSVAESLANGTNLASCEKVV